jgi:hypothetical protein
VVIEVDGKVMVFHARNFVVPTLPTAAQKVSKGLMKAA